MVSGRPRDLYLASSLDNSIPARDSFIIDILFYVVFILRRLAIRGNKGVLVIGSSDYLMVAAVAEISLAATLIIACNSSVSDGYIRLDEFVIRIGRRS